MESNYTYESLPEIQDKNILVIFQDKGCDMAKVVLNEECIMEGNYWDFHNGCYGMNDLPNFRTFSGLKDIIEKYVKSLGKEIEISYQSYKYE